VIEAGRNQHAFRFAPRGLIRLHGRRGLRDARVHEVRDADVLCRSNGFDG